MLHIAEHLLTRRVQRDAALKKWCTSKRFVFNLPVPTQTKVKPPEACAATNDTSGGFTPEATSPDKKVPRVLLLRLLRLNCRSRLNGQVSRLLEVATCRSQSFSSTAQRLLARNGSSCSSSFFALSDVRLVNRRAELADRQSSQVFLADDALLGAMHDQRNRDLQDLHRFLSAAHR